MNPVTPGAGAIWPSERSVATDGLSGATVTRLTCHRGHSNHLYFTENGCWDDGRQLLFTSDRAGAWNLFSCEVATGTLRQVTALPAGTDLEPHGSLDHTGRRYFAWSARRLLRIDLDSNRWEAVFDVPAGWEHGLVACGAGGGSIWFPLSQDIGHDRSIAYADYRRISATPRISRVLRLDQATGAVRVVHEESAWITHVNPSPTDPELATFCHEGPWDLVQRMWVIDHGAVHALRPRDGQWGVGHEFWCSDGVTVGYHARRIGDDRRHLLGFMRHDGTLVHEAETELPTQHAHGLDAGRMVLDGTRATGDRLMLVDRTADGWSAPRLLCVHGTSRHHHFSHAHPRISPDGKSVIYTSDRRGYCDIFQAAIPDDLTRLPLASERRVDRFYWM